jgi:hypothetical protein
MLFKSESTKTVASLVFIAIVLIAFLLPLVVLSPKVNGLSLYDSGDPTSAEQLVLEYVNRARADPIAEGERLGIDIHEGLPDPSLVGPRPPLAMNQILLSIATAHVQDMYNLNYFSHNDPNGTTPFGRMTHAGYNYVLAGENMAGGSDMSATELEDFMMVDSGTPGRPHRVNLLDLINPYPCGNNLCVYNEIGIGYYGGTTPNGNGLDSLITEDFGTTATTGPLLLGVVYNDKNGNNFYDAGEGIGGVTITPSSGEYYSISSSSGGYAIPIGTSGTITVTASGPGFGPITKSITLNGVNVKLDFTTQGSSQATTQSTTQASTQTLTQSTQTSTTQPYSQASFGPFTFQSIPTSFVGASTPGTITACGITFSSGQSTENCAGGFSALANLPKPSTSWEFHHWTWSGGIACSSYITNPVVCAGSNSVGTLTAVYAAQISFMTNPDSSTSITWSSCSNGLANGVSFFSINYGSTRVTACYLPSDYTISNWGCSGGLSCSGSSNSTMVSFTGPGTITLNLQAQVVTVRNSTSSTMPTLSSTTSSMISSSTSTLTTMTSLTYPTPEFGIDQIMMIDVMLAAIIILISRRNSRKDMEVLN